MDIEEPLFQPFPSDIVFQNFEPFETHEVPLQLRNNDKVSCGIIAFLSCVIILCRMKPVQEIRICEYM